MPQSARDRFTVDFEKVFFFVKNRRYYFQQQYEAVKDKARLSRRFFNPQTKRKRIYGDNRIAAINPKTIEASRLRMLEKGRRKRSVWRIAVRPFPDSHFAVYPPELVETPIKAGSPRGGIVLDPFMGSGTTALVARKLQRRFIGIELNPAYVRMAENRLAQGNLA
jgi:site-specific DNA-methyltransferase (adenine-specific)